MTQLSIMKFTVPMKLSNETKVSQYIQDSTILDIKKIEILHARFVRGLKEDYGFTMKQIKDIEDNWLWCGYRLENDDDSSGWMIYKSYFDDTRPDFEDKCVCRQKLFVRNDYLTDGDGSILIIGQCCKDMFIKNRLRTCTECKIPHKNRKDNLCNDCRELKKENLRRGTKCECGKYKKSGFLTCYTCK